MTTVLAAVDGASVVMGADSCTNVYARPIPGSVTKIVRMDAGDRDVLLGVAGDGGIPALLSTLRLPDAPEDGEPTGLWASQVAMLISRAAVEAGLCEDGRMDSHLVLGFAGQVWTLTHGQAIAHPDGRAAVGSGEGPAIGALDALLLTGMDAPSAVRLGVEIACRRDRYSMQPIQLEVLEAAEVA